MKEYIINEPNRLQSIDKNNSNDVLYHKGGNGMAQTIFSVRMDENLKKELDSLCAEFGMTTSTAINIFAKAVVREKRIPFEICSKEKQIAREEAINVVKALREESIRNGNCNMTLDEINEEINAARQDRKKQN